MNSKKEDSLKEAYQKFIQASVYNMPLKAVDDFIAKGMMGYGTAIDEKAHSLDEYVHLIHLQRDQARGIEMSVEFTPVFRNIAPGEDAAIFVDEIAVTMIMDGGKHQLFVRMSCVLEYTENKWLVIHFHASKPGETESDSWHVNEWKRRNEELAQLVTEKTAELEKKNSELLTEACLERVRTQAMGMSKPDDLLGIAGCSLQNFTRWVSKSSEMR
jgi:hypothetical protein